MHIYAIYFGYSSLILRNNKVSTKNNILSFKPTEHTTIGMPLKHSNERTNDSDLNVCKSEMHTVRIAY